MDYGLKNQLKNLKALHKRKNSKKGLGWFVNLNAGNVDYNIEHFNHVNGSNDANIGASEGTALGENLTSDQFNKDDVIRFVDFLEHCLADGCSDLDEKEKMLQLAAKLKSNISINAYTIEELIKLKNYLEFGISYEEDNIDGCGDSVDKRYLNGYKRMCETIDTFLYSDVELDIDEKLYEVYWKSNDYLQTDFIGPYSKCLKYLEETLDTQPCDALYSIRESVGHGITAQILNETEAVYPTLTWFFDDMEDAKSYILKILQEAINTNSLNIKSGIVIDSYSDELLFSAEINDNKITTTFDSITSIELNLNEDVKKNTILNPELWNGFDLNPDVEDKIYAIVDKFVEMLDEDDIKIKVKDILLIGSNVSYNYTDDSDLDLHIIADTSISDCKEDHLRQIYNAYRSLFNNKYEGITLNGIPVEIYVEADESKAQSNGIYSITSGWIKQPEIKDIPEIDKKSFYKEFKIWEDAYNNIMKGE